MPDEMQIIQENNNRAHVSTHEEIDYVDADGNVHLHAPARSVMIPDSTSLEDLPDDTYPPGSVAFTPEDAAKWRKAADGEWTEAIGVSREVVVDAVEDWLDDHPEATTTVEDGSITKAKLASSLQDTVDDVDDLLEDVDEIQQAIADRITSLDTTKLATGHVVEAVGIPVYVDDLRDYSSYSLTDTGWYVFARITAPGDEEVTANTVVSGAAGAVAELGSTHIDVAVRFGVCAEAVTVTVEWDNETDTYTFTAPDLAVRNLDYRTTFYVYDATPFATWSYDFTADTTFSGTKNYYTLADGVYTKAPESAKYTLTADETFQDGKTYYTEASGVYTAATVTTGEAVAADTYYELATVPADTYYTHSKITFAGMARNITYRFNETIDCPMEFVLPAIEDETYGCWFELRLKLNGTYSMTLTPQDNAVKIATEHTQSEQAGFNTIDLHYSVIDGVKLWRFLNTRSTIPST